jgi:Uncharacterized protein conserved in bacteria (DUF2147)
MIYQARDALVLVGARALGADLRLDRLVWIVMLSLGLAARGARGGRGVGQWKTVDEKSGAVQSVVEIYDQGGKLFGKIVSLTKPTDEQGIVGDLLRSGSSSWQSQPDPPREVGRLVRRLGRRVDVAAALQLRERQAPVQAALLVEVTPAHTR